MAASEFNQRLDYLISYSSQLVFVCSDKITSPSQVIEDFLSDQQEQADLALLTANELTPLVIYREKLFRQLISQDQSADFNRPLNQLLAGLNQQNNPVVISIFKADKLPNKLVKELWDLVLQSRFAKNKLHLNILLVGQSTWAEQIKDRLASKSKEQPIILTSDNVERHVDQPALSELETLIQDNRKKFAQRIQARSQTTYLTQSIFKKWWVVALFFMLFLAIFTGLLSWQYPEKRDAVVSVLVQTIVSSKSQESESSEINIVTAPDEKLTPTAVILPETQLPSVESDEIFEQPVLANNELSIETKSIKDELITDWATASAKLEQRTDKILANINQQEPSNADIKPGESKSTITEQIDTPVNSETVQVGKIPKINLTDYAVEDIYQPQLKPIAEATSVNQELRLNHDVVAGLADSEFVIQIAAMANKSILQKYVNDTQLADQLWLYKTQRYGADWYVLLKNQGFVSIQNARAQIANLPAEMVTNTPFVKSVSQVKQEITQSNPQS
jgi:DamX protein